MNYIASLDMSIFVYDYDHNAANADELTKNHYAGYEIVRAAHPDIPILFLTRPNQNGTWEEMYPDTIFDWVEDKDQYREVGFEFQAIIQTNEWNNLSVDVSNSHITIDSIVNIMPQSNMSNTQWIEYNKLESVTIANGKITITANSQITQSLPIKILVR